MEKTQEESKGSTSSDEVDQVSEVDSIKSIISGRGGPPLKISLYLSTNLIVGRNLTLADIVVESYPASKIREMEDSLSESLKSIKTVTPLVDPRAEMRIERSAGNMATLVSYDRIGTLAQQAESLYLNYLAEENAPGSTIAAGDLLDLDLLQTRVSHDHSRNRAEDPVVRHGDFAITGTRRRLNKVKKLRKEEEKHLDKMQEIKSLHLDEKVPILQLAKRFKVSSNILYRESKKWKSGPSQPTQRALRSKRFKKIHPRAKDFIDDFLDSARVPI